MIYAYIRVSTRLQDTENQKFEILKYAHDKKLSIDEFIEETISSRKSYKDRKFGELLNKLKKNDVLIVTEISRFGRSLLEVMEILNQMIQKKVKIFITKNDMELGKNLQSKVLAFAFSLAAEIERELISNRTKEALAKLKAEGRTLGRPKGSLSKSKLDGKEKEIDYYLSKDVSINSLCKILEVAPATFYSFCKNREIDIKKYKIKNKA